MMKRMMKRHISPLAAIASWEMLWFVILGLLAIGILIMLSLSATAVMNAMPNFPVEITNLGW